MKLGGKSKDVDSFVDQLAQEGVTVTSNIAPSKTGLSKPSSAPQIATESGKYPPLIGWHHLILTSDWLVHVTLEEKIILSAGRDGGLQNMELLGLLTLKVSEESVGRIKMFLQNTDNKSIQLQTHPNIDKDLFRSKCVIGLKVIN